MEILLLMTLIVVVSVIVKGLITTTMEKIELSPQQKKLFDKLETTQSHIFITGKAGTGKSSLLHYFKQKSKKNVIVVAPTGVAAINVGGQTIHSFFRLPPSFIARNSVRVDQNISTILNKLDTLVIDEISMVRCDVMEAIDFLLRKARGSDEPFGGVQIVMFGDLYQLPPVVNDKELHSYFAITNGGFYFFNADVWNNAKMEIYELDTIFRQKDDAFKDILNAIRKGDITEHLLMQLNRRVDSEIPYDGTIILTPTNRSVQYINQQHLDQLSQKTYHFKATIEGKMEASSFPTDEVLGLKKGAQVMMIKNDKEKRWVNGSLGIIEDLSEKEIKVDIDGASYVIPKETWSKIRYTYNQAKGTIQEEVISSFTQYPIRLAWAVTIHKSQGQTFDSVIVDMGFGAFAHGQTYVALSRCRTLGRLFLTKEVRKADIIIDPAIIAFMDKATIIS